jgi:transcriptional regulator with XRE-family HTH domain
VLARLRRGKEARKRFIESHLNKGLAYQLRATRDKRGWSQERLAAEVGMNQNAISRLESPDYGKSTITTLKRLAAALDVGLVVRFAPFSEMVDWVSGTPRTIQGLNTSALAVSNFEREQADGAFDSKCAPAATTMRVGPGAADSARTQHSNPEATFTSAVGGKPLSPLRKAAAPAHFSHQQTVWAGAMHSAEIPSAIHAAEHR